MTPLKALASVLVRRRCGVILIHKCLLNTTVVSAPRLHAPVEDNFQNMALLCLTQSDLKESEVFYTHNEPSHIIRVQLGNRGKWQAYPEMLLLY